MEPPTSRSLGLVLLPKPLPAQALSFRGARIPPGLQPAGDRPGRSWPQEEFLEG